MASPKQASAAAGGVRLGLCCLFRAQPVKFRTATATALLRLAPAARLEKLEKAPADPKTSRMFNSRELAAPEYYVPVDRKAGIVGD